MNDTPRVKGYGELLRLSVGLGIDAALALWLCLRDYDRPGRGIVELDSAAWAALSRFYGLGQRATLQKHLSAADNLLWEWQGETVRLFGLGAVTRNLVARAQAVNPDLVQARQFSQRPAGGDVYLLLSGLESPSARRVTFFAAWVADNCRGDHPHGVTACQETLARLWGVSVRTVARWSDWPSVRKSQNWVHAPLSAASMAPGHANEIDTPEGPRLYWRGPCTYFAAPLHKRRRGMASRLVQKERTKGRGPVAFPADGQPAFVRVFWADQKAAQRAKKRTAEQVYYTRSGAPRRTYRGSWWAWQCDLPGAALREAWATRRAVWGALGIA